MQEDTDVSKVEKAGKDLICPVCAHDHFWSRRTLMSTRWATFFGWDWTNGTAINYVCDNCGYIYWFEN